MSDTQLLRLRVNERLSAAAEEIFALVERTIAEYHEEAVRSRTEVLQLKLQIQQLTVLKPAVRLFRDIQPVTEKLLPSFQQCDFKMEEVPDVEETKIQEHPQVKEEQVDQCISPDTEADTPKDAETRLPEPEPATNWDLLPSSSFETVSVNGNKDDQRKERDGSSSPLQRDVHLMSHVAKSHTGQKAFKCLQCNKAFERRPYLVQHTRIHTGEKPFSCDFCGKTLNAKANLLVHMRLHTGDFCNKCRKHFATSNHFKFCKLTPEERNIDEDQREEKSFKCAERSLIKSPSPSAQSSHRGGNPSVVISVSKHSLRTHVVLFTWRETIFL